MVATVDRSRWLGAFRTCAAKLASSPTKAHTGGLLSGDESTGVTSAATIRHSVASRDMDVAGPREPPSIEVEAKSTDRAPCRPSMAIPVRRWWSQGFGRVHQTSNAWLRLDLAGFYSAQLTLVKMECGGHREVARLPNSSTEADNGRQR